MLSRECWQTIGGMDLRSFGRYGWGIDLDLALRARNAGYGLYITEMAYINHFGRRPRMLTSAVCGMNGPPTLSSRVGWGECMVGGAGSSREQ